MVTWATYTKLLVFWVFKILFIIDWINKSGIYISNMAFKLVMHRYGISSIIWLGDNIIHISGDTDNWSDIYISLNPTWIWQNVYFKKLVWSIFLVYILWKQYCQGQ